MYYLKAETSFDAAHFLAQYQGKCRNIHGHHWIVQVRIYSKTLRLTTQEDGMLVDFSRLKADLKAVVEPMDHTLIYQSGSLQPHTKLAMEEEHFAMTEVPFRPTAENFSKYFYDGMAKLGYHVAECTVYETPNNCASYAGEEEKETEEN